MAARVAVHTVVQLIRVAYRMNRICNRDDIRDKCCAICLAELQHLGYVVLRCHDASARMALLLEKINGGSRKLTDLITELLYQLALCAVRTVWMFLRHICHIKILLFHAHAVDQHAYVHLYDYITDSTVWKALTETNIFDQYLRFWSREVHNPCITWYNKMMHYRHFTNPSKRFMI